VKEVERPEHRLPIGRDEVEMVQAIAMRAVVDTGHDTMHCDGGDGQWLTTLRGVDNPRDRALVINRVDENAEHVPLPVVDHRRQRSELAV
jgi:hypothetical protein